MEHQETDNMDFGVFPTILQIGTSAEGTTTRRTMVIMCTKSRGTSS